MNTFPPFVRSLLLTTSLSFAAPLVFVGGVLGCGYLIGYIPGLEQVGHTLAAQILQFLSAFGSGCAVQGILVIGSVCSFVAALFDTYAFYSYQTLKNN